METPDGIYIGTRFARDATVLRPTTTVYLRGHESPQKGCGTIYYELKEKKKGRSFGFLDDDTTTVTADLLHSWESPLTLERAKANAQTL